MYTHDPYSVRVIDESLENTESSSHDDADDAQQSSPHSTCPSCCTAGNPGAHETQPHQPQWPGYTQNQPSAPEPAFGSGGQHVVTPSPTRYSRSRSSLASLDSSDTERSPVAALYHSMLRMEDNQIAIAVGEASDEMCAELVVFVGTNLNRMMDVLTRRRGRLLLQLVRRLGATQCQLFYDFLAAVSVCIAVAQTQDGCIAIPYLIDDGTAAQRSAIAAAVAPNLLQLAMHQYGNFVAAAVAPLIPVDMLASRLTDCQVFTMMACNKFASHFMEAALRSMTPDVQLTTITTVLRDPAVDVKMLSWHRYGNYVIQLLCRMAHALEQNTSRTESRDEAIAECRRRVLSTLGRSPHVANIKKAIRGKP